MRSHAASGGALIACWWIEDCGAADPTWQGMLKAIEKGKKALYANPRMDMPGAKPKPYPVDFGKLFTGFARP